MYTIYRITSKQQEIFNYKRKYNPWAWPVLPFLYSLVSGPEMMKEYLVGMWVFPSRYLTWRQIFNSAGELSQGTASLS